MHNEAKFKITTALLKHGQVKLAEHLDISASEVSRKINGEAGWTLDQLAKALTYVGAQIVPDNEKVVMVPKAEWEAMRTLAKKSLESE
jgi:hypothetical protein